MPNKNSIINSVETKTLRRSPRFFTRDIPPGQVQIPSTRRSLRFLQKNDISAHKVAEFRHSQSANRQVHYSDACFGSSHNVSLKTPKGVLEDIAKKSSKPGDVSSENKGLNTGSKRTSALETGFEGIRTLRRSPRLSFVRKIENELEDLKAKDSKNSGTSVGQSSDLRNLSPRLRRSPRLNNVGGDHQIIGKSRGFSCQQYALDRSSRSRDRKKSCSSDNKVNSVQIQNADTRVSSRRKAVVNAERKIGNSSDFETIAANGEEAQVVDGDMKKKSVARRKRKRDNDVVGIAQGWTKEQEAALQRAYYVAKPTPQFWKKVSKLVPGKSAQDCFDKVHSDHMTPPQSRPRSRAQGTKPSQMEFLSLLEGDLLNLDEAKSRKLRPNKQKSHIAQKTVRYLLQKNYQGAQNSEADLFSLLEPSINLSNKPSEPSRVLSSPKDLKGKQGFVNICHERSLSNHKKPLSRFSNSVETIVVSPPVLKQVKNRALHEKYIDQLHCREAKRKAALRHSKNGISGEVINEVHVVRTDNLRAARNALISEAREAINQLQHLHADAMSKSPDFDGDDYCDNLDYENEDET